MPTTMDTQQFVQLEQQYWQAIQDGDLPTLLRLTDDPCVVAGAQGVAMVDRQTYEKMFTGAKWKVLGFSLSDVQARIAADGVALVAYKVKEELEVEGQPITLNASDTSVWIQKNGQWVCTLHAESVLGDPYGRDRTQITQK
jgi:ketosteroid isomerase-like protein